MAETERIKVFHLTSTMSYERLLYIQFRLSLFTTVFAFLDYCDPHLSYFFKQIKLMFSAH